MPMRLNYNHLRYFWAVAHNGNLTRTAETLHISQSALSLQIKKLEEQLGHQLFERRGKQLRLTDTGRMVLDHADEIFSMGAQLVSRLTGDDGTVETLRVGAIATLSRNFQIRFLNPLLGRNGVRITIRSGTLNELLPMLEDHRLDVVLANSTPPRDANTPWITQTIDEQPISLVGLPQLAATDDALNTLLTQQPLIVPTLETDIRAAFDTYCQQAEIQPRIVAEADDMALLRLLTRSGHGVAVTPPIVVRDELANGILVELAPFPHASEQFNAITLNRRFPNPLLKECLDAVAGPVSIEGAARDLVSG
ncbi:MAG: LysR family transcriptional regulator [Pseudomonadota bacterium]